MFSLMTDHTTDRILYALYCFSRDTCQIDASALARSCGVSATRAAEAMVELERAGLVDASRARLTLLGLARAVSLGRCGGGSPGVDLSHAKPRLPQRAAGLAAGTHAQLARTPQAARHAEPRGRLGMPGTPNAPNGH
jgi:hypothetical protein